MSASPSARVITEALGGSALSLAVQQRRLPRELQPWWPSNPDEWQAHVARVRASMSPEWYEALRPAIAPTGPAASRLERVVREKGVVVTTGQQAGLFGGPLYTLAKALSALGLADALERQLGVPAAPVFWAATDDADFLEASVTFAADADGLHELTLTDKPPPGTPMSRAPLGDMSALLAQLRKSCGSAAYAEYFDMAHTAFTGQRTLGDAYVHLLRQLFESLGISVLDSSHPACTRAAQPILIDALQRASAIAKANHDRSAALRALGFEPQVEDERGLSLVATVADRGKQRVPVDDAARVLGNRAKLALLAPNVLLRPIVERGILPTVAYVAGPAELAYFAQSSAVADAMERHAPVGVPRWSCTVIEPFAAKALARLGVDYDALRDVPALERRLASSAVPSAVQAAWRSLQEQIEQGVRQFGAAVRDTSLMPPEVVEGIRRSLAHKLSRAERRLLAAVKRRDERVRRDLQCASAALFPLGKRQERVLNYIPMLTRVGSDLLDEMRGAAGTHAVSLLTSRTDEPVAAR